MMTRGNVTQLFVQLYIQTTSLAATISLAHTSLCSVRPSYPGQGRRPAAAKEPTAPSRRQELERAGGRGAGAPFLLLFLPPPSSSS
jgi:hypothetical protein